VVGAGVVDPSHNFAFEVHQYLDSDNSGTHSNVVSTTIGVERLTAITAWAEATGNKLFLGEFGVASDATSLTALNNMLGYMAQHTGAWEGGTYWAAGAWWGPYMYSVEPANGVDKPQMGVLQQYVQTTIEANGSTTLAEFAGHYFLDNATGTGPMLQNAGAAVVAGQLGGWIPFSAEQTASGYEVALKLPGSSWYGVWNTDSSGNTVSSIGSVLGTSSGFESLEASFHQDLNGDGVIGLAVAANATLELNSAHSDAVTFNGSTGTLKLDNPSTFTGQIVGFTGDGTLAGSDQVDLLNMSYSSSIQTSSTYSPSAGTVTVSNGTTVDVLNFVGNYSQANFKFASDGHGGTIVYDPPATSHPASGGAIYDAASHVAGDSAISGSSGLNSSHLIVDSGATPAFDKVAAAGNPIANNGTVKVADNSMVSLTVGAGPDNFVFASNFGQAAISHFKPGTDLPQIDHAVFASMDALLAATRDDQHGYAVFTDAAHDTLTNQNVTTAQLFAHQGDFHLV
jgi:hypothetical protein